MPKVDFCELELESFKCFVGEPQVLELDKLGPGLHFVRGRNEYEPRLGPNGAGKSTLWDALSWCLYGKTPDGSRNPDIQPWRGKKKRTAVRVDLKVNGKRHLVERTANPNSLTLDGEPVGQEQIESLVGLSLVSFCHTILLGQGQPLFFDLSPRDKLQLFSDVLQLERWEARSKLAAERARQFEQQEAVLTGELTGQEASHADLQEMLVDAQTKSAEWSDAQVDRLRMAEEELGDIKRRLGFAEERHNEVEPKHDWSCTQVKLMTSDLVAFDKFVVRADTLQAQRQELASAPTHCPTCGQSIKHAGLAGKIKQLDAEIKKTKKSTAQAQRLREDIRTRRAEIDHMLTELQSLNRTIEQLRAQRDAKQKVLDEREDQANPYREQVSTMRKRVNKLAAQMKETKALIAKAQRRTERAKFWVKGFKDVRLFVIGEVLQELELATNAALDDVGLIGWQVKFDVEKETKAGTVQRGLNVTIASPATKQRVRWESWSGGEGQRLRVVGALALSEVLLQYAGVQTSLEILDEPAHFMAPDGVRDLTEYLAWRAQGLGRQIWYIDHMSIDSSSFASVTTVIKTEAGAHLG